MELELIAQIEEDFYRSHNVSFNESLAEPKFDFVNKNKAIAVPYMFFITVVMVMGAIGNVLVLGTLIIIKKLRTVSNIFVANLAIADFCVTGFADPFSIIGMVCGPGWFATRMGLCRAIGFVCTTSCIVSILTIVMISVNRYVHICHGSRVYLAVYTRRNTLLMCAAIWITTAAFQMPQFWEIGNYDFDVKSFSCTWNRLHKNPYMIVVIGLMEIFSAIVVGFTYVKIFMFVKETRANVKSSRSAQRERDESVKLAKTIAIIFLVFFLCWAPYTVVILIDRADRLHLTVHLWVLAIAHANSSFNSIVYATQSKQFRIGYMRLLMLDRCVARLRYYTMEEENSTSSRGGTTKTPNTNGKTRGAAEGKENLAYKGDDEVKKENTAAANPASG